MLSRAVTSRHSLVSESSSDYALPPDEVSIQNESGDSEPEHKLLKFTHVGEQRQQVSVSASRSVSALTGQAQSTLGLYQC